MKTTLSKIIRASVVGILSLGFSTAWASTIQYNIDTSGFTATSAQLGFDLVDGGSPSNSVTISGFTTNGTLGSVATIGDATGTLPGVVTLSDSTFFNEYLQNITLGSQISFVLDDTGALERPEEI